MRFRKPYALILLLLTAVIVSGSYRHTNANQSKANPVLQATQHLEVQKRDPEQSASDEPEGNLSISIEKHEDGAFTLHMPNQYEPRLDTHSYFPLQKDGWVVKREKFSRAFYWGVSDVRLDKEAGHLQFTFAANLLYAIGQDARLEVCMVNEGDTWRVADFGSLHIEGPDEDITIPGVNIPARACGNMEP